MEKLTVKQITEILRNERKLFNGDRRAAVAAFVMTPGVVMKAGYREPTFSNRQLVSHLKSQVTKYENEQSSKKAQKKAAKKKTATDPSKNANTAEQTGGEKEANE